MTTMRCQDDSYETEVEVEVLACEPSDSGFHTTISQTILYPGGGGQPSDEGRVSGLQIGEPLRTSGLTATYATSEAVALGMATLELDWARRFDHMQQHTAQHLISALAQDHLGLETIAFHLNAERSDVVLGGGRLNPDILLGLETLVNQAIRSAIPVVARLIEPSELKTEGVRSRRLPPDHEGSLRVVEIEGIDLNTCGGTHVGNTAELQAVRLLQSEESKGTFRVHYWAGGRVIHGHRDAWAREVLLIQ